MSLAEALSASTAVQRWDEICARYPDEWVCVIDTNLTTDGSIASARVVGHGPSIRQLLNDIGKAHRDGTVLHTRGRPLRLARIEMTDETRDLVRSGR